MFKVLRCEMEEGCTGLVTHLDEKGYVYCMHHGKQRRGGGIRCRQLKPAEVKRLQNGERLTKY